MSVESKEKIISDLDYALENKVDMYEGKVVMWHDQLRDIRVHLSKAEGLKADILKWIMDNAYSLTFQTIGQYRSALVKEIEKL